MMQLSHRAAELPRSRFALFALTVTATVTLSTAPLRADDVPRYRDRQASLEDRVESLFQAMTPEERLTLLGGADDAMTHAVPRLGVPPMVMLDATQGAHGSNPATAGKATLFTSGALLAATWDTDLAERIGRGVGTEVLNKGTGGQVLLGPGLNILRTPLGGRSGEYIGGEDPHLESRMGVAYIRGVQDVGCAACMKHYACNNQEFLRGIIDVHVDERALREIYTPAFIAAAKEAHVWTAMAAYNRINGAHCSTNWYLLQQLLKREGGFDGLVMTDWFSAGSTLESNDGCDLEMPNSGYAKPELTSKALASGELIQANVDDSVRRAIRTIIRVGLMDPPHVPDPNQINKPEHQQLALEAAEKGIVLLKNARSLLPLNPATTHSIALIGPACKQWQMGCSGSAHVDPVQSTSAYEGIVHRALSAPGPIKILYDYGFDDHGETEHFSGSAIPPSALRGTTGETGGLTAEFFNGYEFAPRPAATRLEPRVQIDKSIRETAGIKGDHYCVRWTGTLIAPATGNYRMNLEANIEKSGARLFIDDRLILDLWPGFDGSKLGGHVEMLAGTTHRIRVEYVNIADANRFSLSWLPPHSDPFANAVQTARAADVAVVFVGTRQDDEEEFKDRRSMSLPGIQDDLIRAVAAANPNAIVVLNNGGPVLVSGWNDQVAAMIEAFFPAQAGGDALAGILFGDVNPSGKLAYTIGKAREDYPDYLHYPVRASSFRIAHAGGDLAGTTSGHPIVDYAEGIYVGYRAFDKRNIEPSYPFGFGLSYTAFSYTNLTLSKPTMEPADTVVVNADLTNAGPRDGAEVVQLYMQPRRPQIDRPIRELKGFSRVELKRGETKRVRFQLTARDLAYCDVPGKQWKADAGEYRLELGSSSRDIRASGDVKLTAAFTDALPGMGARSPYEQPSLALGKTATASSSQEGFPATNATDDDERSRWSSSWSDPQWLSVDLGQATRFDHAHIAWEAAYAKQYHVETSVDGSHWDTVCSVADGKGGSETLSFKPVTARWVRLVGEKRATTFGYSIFDFSIYESHP